MNTGHLSKFILLALITTTSMQSFAAADALCVNQAARKYAVQVLNAELGEKKKAVTEAGLFLKPVVIENKKQNAFMIYATLGEVFKDVVASPAFHKSEVSEFNYHWHFFWGLPRGTGDSTPLEKLFCLQAPAP